MKINTVIVPVSDILFSYRNKYVSLEHYNQFNQGVFCKTDAFTEQSTMPCNSATAMITLPYKHNAQDMHDQDLCKSKFASVTAELENKWSAISFCS